jgi:HEAT repeat protein
MSLFGPNVEKLEQRGDTEGLVNCLDNKDATVRKDAVDALSRLKDKATVGSLMAALADPSRDVRSSVLNALEAIDSVSEFFSLIKKTEFA